MKTNVKMNCPHCKNEIQLDSLLVSQFRDSIKLDLEKELSIRQEELNRERQEYNVLAEELSKQKNNLDDIVSLRVKTQLKSREEQIKETIRQEINEEKSLQLQELENELVNKTKMIKELNGTKAQLERLRREMEEQETKIVLDKERELNERLEQARSTIKEQLQQETFLKLKERESVIDQLKEQLDIAKRKAEQGSMQLQGEAMETSLEQMLRELHSSDEISEIRKGAVGADCIQNIMVNGATVGRIIYEVKNTKSFSPGWVPKIKEDSREAKADLMVIVSKNLPNPKEKFCLVDGVWITTLNNARDLSLILRFGLLKVASVQITQQGKQTKSQILFDYLVSEDFKQTMEAVLDGLKSIQESHESEKLKMQRLWREREKALEQVLSNCIQFWSTIKGTVGKTMPEIESLQFLPKAG